MDVEYIEKAPPKKVKELPHQRKAKEYLDDEEVKAILKRMNRKSYTEYRDMLVMMIMLDCGISKISKILIDIKHALGI